MGRARVTKEIEMAQDWESWEGSWRKVAELLEQFLGEYVREEEGAKVE